jgi:hypothetical protein
VVDKNKEVLTSHLEEMREISQDLANKNNNNSIEPRKRK